MFQSLCLNNDMFMIYIFTDILIYINMHYVSTFYQLHMFYLCFEVFPHLLGGCTRQEKHRPPARKFDDHAFST